MLFFVPRNDNREFSRLPAEEIAHIHDSTELCSRLVKALEQPAGIDSTPGRGVKGSEDGPGNVESVFSLFTSIYLKGVGRLTIRDTADIVLVVQNNVLGPRDNVLSTNRVVACSQAQRARVRLEQVVECLGPICRTLAHKAQSFAIPLRPAKK